MKKLISALAALCLTLCLTGTVFAASGTGSGIRDNSALPGSSSIDVTAECHIDVNYYEIILGASSDSVTLPDDITLRSFSPKQENNGPSFAMAKNSYYVFLKANSGGYYYHPTTPETTPSAATTGDAGISAYIVCAAVSAAGIVRIGRKRK